MSYFDSEFQLSVKNDFAFKQVFAGKDSKDILIDFLGYFLKLSIKNLIFLPTQQERGFEEDKYGILDVEVELDSGILVDIEIQLRWFSSMPERSFYYLTKMYNTSITRGEDYSKVKKCITINIIEKGFTLNSLMYSKYTMLENTTHEALFDKAEIYFVNLERLDNSQDEDIGEGLLHWLQFINSDNAEERMMLAKKSSYIAKAKQILEEIPQDPEQRHLYISREKAIRDKAMLIYEGRKEGRDEGIEIGMEMGMEKGRLEERIELAKRLKGRGMSLEEIAAIIGVERTEIERWFA